MKKVFIWIISIILFLIVATGVVLFTPPGNALLKPIIESKINQNLPQKIKLDQFSLTPSNFYIKIIIEKDSYIDAKGKYSLFSKSFDAKYQVKIKDLSKISPLIGYKLRGNFFTKGAAKGDISKILINGITDLAKSKSDYNVEIKNLKPAKVLANISSLHIEDILYMFYKPQFIKGKLNADVKLSSLEPNNLKGFLKANMKSSIDTQIMKKDFNVTLPKTSITADINSKLKKTSLKYSAKVLSNLAKIASSGKVDTKNIDMDIKYFVLIKELAMLKPIINFDLRGPLKTEGVVKGDKNLLTINGKSNIALSKTDYKVILKDFKPKSADSNIKNAKLSKILYMLNMPVYADADIDMKANFKNLDIKNIDGDILTTIKNGVTYPKVLYKEFNLTNAYIKFKAFEKTVIKNSVAKSKANINSSVAKADIKNAIYDIKNSKLNFDFTLYIPNLDKLYFATKKHLRGDLKVVGDIKKDKDLIINAHSDTLGGRVDFKLVNENITKTIRGIKVTSLTDMLIYPRVFDSTMDADIKYNLKTKKGQMNAKLLKGRILPNQMTFLLNQMAKFDITKEIYEVTTIDSKIDNMVIISDLDMESRLTHISSKKALLDMNKNRVDAKLKIDIKNRPVFVKIRGDINKPKISIDASSILKEKIEKKLEKKIPKQFQEPLKQILKMF
ncbi:hypothetical protein [Nitrosophilus kaiyonis]|uniref:hypothetical protein n=1 Tax=Nitrosophilus kaiyonis TaxID=2930200 RepID=UPI0024936F37|nr:hypothetical protein [Nitrosophilus kaiyonis]